MPQRFASLLKLAVGPLLLLALLRVVGVRPLWESLRHARPEWLAVAVGAYFLTNVLRGYRWQVLLAAQHLAVPLHRLIWLDFVGSCFNLVLPSSVGGDVVKYYKLARQEPLPLPHGQARVVSSLLADRLCGLLVLLWMGAAVVPWARGQVTPGTAALLVAMALLSAAGLATLLNARLRAWAATHVPGLAWLLARPGIRGLYASLDGYRAPALAHAALASALCNVAILGVNGALGLAFGVPLTLLQYLIFVPLISLLLALPLSVNGLGVRESGYLFFFGQAGVAPPLALSMGLGYYGCTVAAGLVGALLLLVESLLDLRRVPLTGESRGN